MGPGGGGGGNTPFAPTFSLYIPKKWGHAQTRVTTGLSGYSQKTGGVVVGAGGGYMLSHTDLGDAGSNA